MIGIPLMSDAGVVTRLHSLPLSRLITVLMVPCSEGLLRTCRFATIVALMPSICMCVCVCVCVCGERGGGGVFASVYMCPPKKQ